MLGLTDDARTTQHVTPLKMELKIMNIIISKFGIGLENANGMTNSETSEWWILTILAPRHDREDLQKVFL